MPNSSGEPMPSRAKANTVFFCASVDSTCALSPLVCAAAKSPRRAELSLRSTSEWRGAERSTATTRTSAFPYWLGPRTIAMAAPSLIDVAGMLHVEPRGSAAAVGRVGERREQQRHVVVLARLADGEAQHHLRPEGLPALGRRPRAGAEHQPVRAGRGGVLGEPAAPVGVRG